MAYVQFLSGHRDQEFQELNDSASLSLGSTVSPPHIVCKDPGIEANHCTIYPAQGSFWLQNLSAETVFDMRRLPPNTTEQLHDKQVFIVGRTFVKFWLQKPAGADAAGAPASGADPEAQAKLAEAEAELERLRSSGQQQIEQTRRELESSQARTRELEGQLSQAQSGEQEARGKISQAEAEAERIKRDAQAEVERVRGEARRLTEEAQQKAEAELEEAKAELEAAQAKDQEALKATRSALEALRARGAARGSDPLEALRSPSDLEQALAALNLDSALSERLRRAVADQITRETAVRLAGPVVPLRGLKLDGAERDLEEALTRARQREAQAKTLRELGLANLDPAALGELLEAGRS